MPLFKMQALVTQLGREFTRRDMRKHVELLRGFYRAQFGSPRPPESLPLDLVLEWLALLQIGPFAGFYQTSSLADGCPFCKTRSEAGAPSVWVEAAWPGGALIRCVTCGRGWVRGEEEPQSGALDKKAQ